jgi:hypothetical protein
MKDELKRLTELDPGEETFKEELLKIRWEKILNIQYTITGLRAVQKAEEDYEGEKEFASFLWEDIFPKTEMFNIRFEKFLSDPKVQKNLNLMASIEYTPPNQFRETCIHLIELYAYYVKIYVEKEPFSLVELVLDYSLSKLMFGAGIHYEYSLHYGHREIKRYKDGAKSIKEKAEENAQPIKDTFQGLHFPKELFPNGVSLHKVADTIYAILDDKVQEPPSVDTIKRILKRDPEIWGKFKPKKIKNKTFYILQT